LEIEEITDTGYVGMTFNEDYWPAGKIVPRGTRIVFSADNIVEY
jgi:hypothetical protein